MRRIKILAALAAAVLLAACASQPEPKAQPAQPAAQADAPKAAAQPVEGASKTLAKPVFIDFYAPW